jgi:regulatory protein
MARAEPTALDAALGALRHRDLSTGELDERLRAKGFDEADRTEALATLERTGLVDDARFAIARAQGLAARGLGDAGIRHALLRAGIDSELVPEALATIEPETERALAIVARRGGGPKSARYLLGKGFAEEVVAGVVARMSEEELG